MRNTFASFRIRNFRLWIIGLFVSATGSWMQMTAQDWIVLTELTDHDAVALGTVVALQFVPQIVLSPLAGALIDRWSARVVLLVSQVMQLVLALALGILVVTGAVTLWHVYVLALLMGCVSAFDGPARNTFIVQLVSDEYLTNGIALNSAAFNSARLVGPAVAGVTITLVGTGWVFFVNALTFAAVIVALLAIRVKELTPHHRPEVGSGGVWAGLRYIGRHRELVVVMSAAFLIGMFSLNAAVVLATMVSIEFDGRADTFGLLTTALGAGSVIGSLVSASIRRSSLQGLAWACLAFAITAAISSVMPGWWAFAAMLPLLAVPMLIVMTTANARVQLITDPPYRGRVMGVYMAVFMGSAPVGGPLLGLLVNLAGPRWAMGGVAALGLVAAAILGVWLLRHRRGRGADEKSPSVPAELRMGARSREREGAA